MHCWNTKGGTHSASAKVAVGILGIIAAIAGAKHHIDSNLAFNAGTTVGTLGAEFLATPSL